MSDILFILNGFVVGLLSFFSPCSLSMMPAYISYITSSSKSRAQTIVLSLVYTLGYALTYGIVGTLITFGIANVNITTRSKFNLIAGPIAMMFAIYLFFSKEIQKFFRKHKKSSRPEQDVNANADANTNTNTNIDTNTDANGSSPKLIPLEEGPNQQHASLKSKSFITIMIGAFALGFSTGGIGNACATPMFAAMMTIASTLPATTVLYVLILYAIGLTFPLFLIGLILSEVNNRYLAKMISISAKISKVLALLLFWFGLEIFLTGFGIKFILSML